MAAYNIDFVLAQSTGQALAELRKQRFDAVISEWEDLRIREPVTLCWKRCEEAGIRLPILSTLGQRTAAHVREARSLGAQGTTNMGDELLQMVLRGLNV